MSGPLRSYLDERRQVKELREERRERLLADFLAISFASDPYREDGEEEYDEALAYYGRNT